MDLAGWRSSPEFERINPYSIPFYWATTFVFEKTPLIQSFFDLISYIKINWNYFRQLYNIETMLYRNDFAFSIAINIMNGKIRGSFTTELPGKMVYTTDKDILVNLKGDVMNFLLEKKDHKGEYVASKTQGLDVHVMNKFSLSRFIDGGSGV
jgi:ATP-dependent helicase/DNAse subunit B